MIGAGMRCPSAAELLDTWEGAMQAAPPIRALRLLAAAHPGETADSLARLPLGERDGRLLTLHEALFGSQIAGLAACPACGEQLELAFAVTDIRTEPALSVHAGTPVHVSHHGYDIQCRLLDTLDQVALIGAVDAADCRALLLERCVLTARCGNEEVPAGQLPDAVVAALAGRLAEADPQADIQLALSCPACGHAWQAVFDIGSFLWAEVHAWAQRMLRDVHWLARAYGWREADILSLSAWRRQVYLAMVGDG
jgi:uncharacterized protein (UPF0212 family)